MYKITIKYYDKNIIIINKPVGIEVNKILKIKIKNNIPNKGILNRLDKYTSGIIMIARNLVFYYFYKKIILLQIIKKKYIVFVDNKTNNGFINLSILKKKKISIEQFSKKSLSFYKKIKKLKSQTLLFVYIKTGRTHQIRKHLIHCGIMIKNEFYYNKIKKFINTLHFKTVSFFYPFNLKILKLSCNIPNEMKKIFLINFLK
ncbi:pseudouridine synthase [Candidatus Carsonella ruddii]|uniref:RluA family pseudouridine synthase n=1 Tax=Candidatus Carsonella ruddii (Diaphorina cf. continua) TaxID=2661587 RepID=A0A7R6VYD0_CARRU|nr:RNA pseudouridine synthase [Candidatus Carsonella ruddii (Diaphorina cf. continua)]BCG49367.1 RluA family pseudouridine synthase [Candidatus Carsonella ruddii (Diaphorina cf. continua)]